MNHLDLSDGDIVDSIRDVRNDKTETNWALFTYVPRTNKIKLASTGTGHVDELIDDLTDSKIFYGYLRYEMSEVWKYVFITYCGEGVPGTSKGLLASHTADFDDYLKKNAFNYAVQINGRNEKDLKEAEIIKALNKTSTFIRAKSTAAKPTESIRDTRDSFWREQTARDAAHKEEVARHQKEKEEELARSRAMHADRLAGQASELLSAKDTERQAQADAFRREQAERTTAEQQRLEAEKAKVFANVEARRAATETHADATAATPSSAPPPRSTGRGTAVKTTPATTTAKPATTTAKPASTPAAKPAPKPEPVPEPEPEPQPEAEPAPEPAPEPEPEPEPQPTETAPEQPLDGGEALQARALYDYSSEEPSDLQFKEGDLIMVVDRNDPSGWWQGELNGVRGTFPSNFVELI
ncbi:cervical SH3P7 [Pelomyxa schiedti]|nr:cervical SH3P7 [Pelomyxa schiedti]